MPTYSYECQDCGHVMDLIKPYDEHDVYTVCDICHHKYLLGNDSYFKRVFSPPKTFILKGACWAKDNYASPSNKDKSKSVKESKEVKKTSATEG
jgi:putative FmdB family regulatory protein